jgi:hypothetical protein
VLHGSAEWNRETARIERSSVQPRPTRARMPSAFGKQIDLRITQRTLRQCSRLAAENQIESGHEYGHEIFDLDFIL